MKHLAAGRAARNLPPVTLLAPLPAVVGAARLAGAGEREPVQALNAALSVEASRTGQTLRGWALTTNDLDVLPFPSEMLTPTPLAVRVVVTPYRPQDIPWGAYLIYLVASVPPQQRVAVNRAVASHRAE